MPRILLILIALFLTLPAFAQDVTPEPDRTRIEGIVRDYLLTNPEIMLEVQAALEAKQAELALARAKEAITRNQTAILSSKNQAVVGNPDGDVTLVEFFDYNCGFCQRAMNDMNELLAKDDKLRFVLKELPILGPGSVTASQVSTAVYRLHPDRYAEFHGRLLGLDAQKDGATARTIAEDMGFDMAALNAEADKPDVIDAFREVNRLADELGISGTPSYIIGDEVVFGALGADVLARKVSNMRACGRTECG
ncbi:DsbA family protein [Rhizobiaceae bacterium]|nr:DsbA family protein [Rhizobiaceae bacterium]